MQDGPFLWSPTIGYEPRLRDSSIETDLHPEEMAAGLSKTQRDPFRSEVNICYVAFKETKHTRSTHPTCTQL